MSKVVNAVVDDSFTVEKFGVLDSLNSPYFVQLQVVGNAVTASFFDEFGTNLITELSTVDTDPLGAGFVGLSVGMTRATDVLCLFGSERFPVLQELEDSDGFDVVKGSESQRYA